MGFEPTTGRLEAVCSDSTELRKRMVDGRVVQEKATTLFQRSNFALVICFQTGHPRLFGVVFFFHCPTPRQLEHAVPVNERRKKLGTPIGRISVEIFSKRVRKGSNG